MEILWNIWICAEWEGYEHKAPFRKQLSAQAFKVYSIVYFNYMVTV